MFMNRKWIIVGIVAAMLLVGGYVGWQSRPEEKTAVSPPQPSSAIVNTGAEGMVVPIQQARLAAEGSGAVAEMFVEEGAMAAAGDPLLRLDSTDEEILVEGAETAVSQAQSILAAALVDVTIAQLGVDGARLDVRAAEAEFALLEAGATAEQIALSEQNTAVAEAAVTQAAGGRDLALEGANNAQIAAAQAGVTAAQTAYDNAQRTHQPIAQDEDADAEVREQARLALAASYTDLAAAQASLDALDAGATGFERTAANSGVTAAASQFEAASAQHDLLLQGSRAEQIAIAQAVLDERNDGITAAELKLVGAQTAVSQAEAAVAEAEAGLESARHMLEKRTLTAPFTGTVMAVEIKAREYARAGVPVIVLADLSGWQVETTDFSEFNVTKTAVGQSALVTVDAFAGQEWNGRVTAVANTSTVSRGDVNYTVTVALDEVDVPLRWGMTAYVELK